MPIYVDGVDTNFQVPSVDSGSNTDIADVIGNKTDTISGDSLISNIKLATGGGSGHIKLFAGDIYYVDTTQTDDTGDGITPETAKKTIGAAITEASAGDAINVRAGIYTENVTISDNSVELWCDIGTIIDGDATCLTVSGDNCKINNGIGSCKITPATDQVGINITGENCQARNVRVKGATDAGNSWNLAGGGAILHECRASGIKTGNKGFNITSNGNKLYYCGTIGSTTSYGYYFSGSIKNGLLVGCTSSGHQTSGFYIATDVSAYTLLNCSSGAADGKWRDIDDANVWSNFAFDNTLYKVWTAAGATSTNLFKVTGTVQIEKIYGHVTTVLSADVDTLKLDLNSTAGANDITDTIDPASAPVGSLLIKDDDALESLAVYSSATNNVIEQSTSNQSGQQPIVAFDLQQEAGEDTYIRVTQTGIGASGQIHWHVIYKPVTDDGFIEVV